VRVDVENVSNGSTVEALWALGALEPKKRLKRPDVRVGVWWKGCRKQPPKAPFSATFSQVSLEFAAALLPD
jgi:hypothetical protein